MCLSSKVSTLTLRVLTRVYVAKPDGATSTVAVCTRIAYGRMLNGGTGTAPAPHLHRTCLGNSVRIRTRIGYAK